MAATKSVGGLVQLCADTMFELDRGRVRLALDARIREAILDCEDRPGDDRARKVTLEVEFKPVAEIHGETISCEGVKGVVKVKGVRPPHQADDLDFGLRKNGVAVFSPESPANHRQSTFFDGDEDQ